MPKKYYCIDCGKEISRPPAERCGSCAKKGKRKQKQINYCVDCGKKISKNAKKCVICNNTKGLTIEFIKDDFEKEGCILKSTEYVGYLEKLDYICPNGHKQQISWSSWRQGHRCTRCASAQRVGKIAANYKDGRSTKQNRKKYCQEYNKKFYIEHRKERALSGKIWRENNRDKKSANQAKREAMKMGATPPDADLKKIQEYYTLREEMSVNRMFYHVDHIQPLSKGGLHHEDNLQVLESKLNIQKNAKWPLSPEEKIRYRGFRI